MSLSSSGLVWGAGDRRVNRLSDVSGEKGSPGEIKISLGDPGQKGEKGLSGNPGPEGETGSRLSAVTQWSVFKMSSELKVLISQA